MSEFIVAVKRTYEYEVRVIAKDEYDALEGVRDYEIEDLEPYEVNAEFDYEVWQSDAKARIL